jgi:hypothetical protein
MAAPPIQCLLQLLSPTGAIVTTLPAFHGATLGRAPDCTLQFAGTSLKHARLEYDASARAWPAAGAAR